MSHGSCSGVDLVGQAHRRGDDRAGRRVETATGLHHEAEQVAVAREPATRGSGTVRRAGRAAWRWSAAGRCCRTCRPPARPCWPAPCRPSARASGGAWRRGRRRLVDEVSHDEVIALALQLLHLAQRAEAGTGVVGLRQVGVVEGVLGTVVAADVALATEPARAPGQLEEVAVRLVHQLLAGHRRPVVVVEPDGERDEAPVLAELGGGVAKRRRLARGGSRSPRTGRVWARSIVSAQS